jgi:Fe-Mn family superoxide dismutase
MLSRKEFPMANAAFSLPPLPFATDALAPAISAATFAQHHAGHHQAYVDKLNLLAGEEEMEDATLIEIIRETADADPDEVSELVSAGDLFVHAAQHFNHAFYWKSLAADGGEPTGDLLASIERDFGSFDHLRQTMVTAARAAAATLDSDRWRNEFVAMIETGLPE